MNVTTVRWSGHILKQLKVSGWKNIVTWPLVVGKKIFSYFQTKIFFNGTMGPPSYTDTIPNVELKVT